MFRFNKQQRPPGKLLDWQSLGTLHLTSRLFIGDAYTAPHGAHQLIDLDPGPYEITAQRMDFGIEILVATLRICRETNPIRGPVIEQTYTDSEIIAICDHDRFQEVSQAWDPETYMTPGFFAQDFVQIPIAPNTPLFTCRCGIGDTPFCIHELLDSNGTRVGAEIAMLEVDATYPFEHPRIKPF